MRRQKSANTKPNSKPETTKSLGDRYAELLKLREVVSRTQSELMKHSTNGERAGDKVNRALSYH